MKIREVDFDNEIIHNLSNNSNRNRSDKPFKEYNIRVAENLYFQDDYWDFNNKNTLNKDTYLYKYDFSEIDYRYKDFVKKIVLDLLIIKNKSASTTKGSYFSSIKSFILYLQENNIYYPRKITKKIMEEYFSMQCWSERTKDSHRTALTTFLAYIEEDDNGVNYTDIYKYFNERDTQKKLAQKENGKTKIIPSDIFDNIMGIAVKEIQDKNLSIKDRYIACMIVMLGETGMRIGEFLRLERDKVRELKIDENRRIAYLEFITYKIIKNKNTEFRWTETYLTDKSKLAYDTMNEFSKNKQSKYIFYGRDNNLKPCNDEVARGYLLRFTLRHYIKLGLDKAGNQKYFSCRKIKNSNRGIVGVEFKNLIGQEAYTVNPHQFRVTVCTRLYENGVPLEFIRKHMNHLSEEMTCHYIRTKEINQKKLKAMNLIKARINSKGDLLETNIEKAQSVSVKKELERADIRKEYETINKFIKKGKFKIMKDIDQIIDLLTVAVTPLTETPEGYCARSALASLCERQEYVSSLNNVDSIEAYIPALEYVDITYRLFKEKVKLVKHNKKVSDKKPIYKVEYTRELKSLKSFINKRFLPEIQLVKDKIKDIGIDESIKNYPNLKDILFNMNNIDKEIFEWTQ